VAGTVPSRSIGVHSWVRSHCEPQPVQVNRGSGGTPGGSGSHLHASWQANWASGSGTVPSSWARVGGREPRLDPCSPYRDVVSAIADDATTAPARLTAFVRGDVQGVGFRWWARARALELGLVGHATNRPDGRVQVVAEGDRSICARLLALLAEQPSTTARPGRVTGVTEQWSAPRGTTSGFVER
jgi:acylphosphatase